MIYLVGKDFNNPFKVGRSGDVKRRLKDIQTYTPFPVKLIGEIFVEDDGDFTVEDSLAEKEVHRLLSDYRVHGEWFQCSYESFCRAVARSPLYYIWLEPTDDDAVWEMLDDAA